MKNEIKAGCKVYWNQYGEKTYGKVERISENTNRMYIKMDDGGTMSAEKKNNIWYAYESYNGYILEIFLA